MRPTSIVLFERLFLLSLAIALVNGFLQYDALVAQVGNDPALAQLGWGSGAILVVMAISLLIPLLLWYFIARRASNIAKWILVVMTLLGLLFVNLDAGQLGSLAGIASLAVTILQLVAIVLLFRADARAWLSDDADDADDAEAP